MKNRKYKYYTSYFYWGNQIRTDDDGVKVRCLTSWRYPSMIFYYYSFV